MSKKAGTALSVMAMVFMGALASPLTVLAADAEETYQPALYATIWALLPPLVAIILALITKEVYSSLFVGIVVGALLYLVVRNRDRVPEELRRRMIVMALLSLIQGFTQTGTDNMAHLGGFLGGILICIVVCHRKN